MRAALREAQKAKKANEVPVGAIVVRDSTIIGRGFNQMISLNDPSAHAEIRAIRQACRRKRNYRLLDCELYVTLEPCAMCLGTALQARLKRLIFGAFDPKSGAAGSLFQMPIDNMNHRIQVTGGVLEKDCGQILKDFFSKKR
jgi:tRNA(adenine34) deaminase